MNNLICPKAYDCSICNGCYHRMLHVESAKCHGYTCSAFPGDIIVNCETEIKVIRTEKLKKINGNIADIGSISS